MKAAALRSTLALSAIALALAGCLQEGAISPSHAANGTSAPVTAPALTPPVAPAAQSGRYGLPDFSALVEQVGPAVVNISVTQKLARGGATSGEDPFADDPFYDFLRRFGVPVPGGSSSSASRHRRGSGRCVHIQNCPAHSAQ